MVLFGDHAASPHGTPGNRKLKQNEYVLFDLGVVYEHYCSDMTRTVKFGNPSEDAQNIYKTVLKAEQSAIEAIKPGVMIKTLIKLLEILLAKRDTATISSSIGPRLRIRRTRISRRFQCQ